ncbi:MAG TPA: arylesterase [Oxalobacteraceae bacterium]|nr:arylesterase [Oxalobacteraceae bacterium]
MRGLRTLILIGLTMAATSAYSASKTVLVLGDSLSAEYGLARGTGWLSLLQKRLQTEKVNAEFVNASISGETTSGGKSRLDALLAQQHPAVVIIELGANDGLRGLSLAASEANLRAMIAASHKAKARVLLIGMRLPPNYGRDYTQKFSAMYAKLAKESNTALVPFFLAGLENRPELFQADRLHPTADGQAIMLDNVWPHLKPLLTK